jgi:hypothetical protein
MHGTLPKNRLPGMTPGAFLRSGLGRCTDLVFLVGGVFLAAAPSPTSPPRPLRRAAAATSAAASCIVASDSIGGATAVRMGRGLNAAGGGTGTAASPPLKCTHCTF